MPIILDKVAAKIKKMLTRDDVARDSDKVWYKDNIAWWMDRYKTLITTEAEVVVQKAIAKHTQAVALNDEGINLVEQLDRDIIEAEYEIKRLGGDAFIENSEPILKELKVYFDNLYESSSAQR